MVLGFTSQGTIHEPIDFPHAQGQKHIDGNGDQPCSFPRGHSRVQWHWLWYKSCWGAAVTQPLAWRSAWTPPETKLKRNIIRRLLSYSVSKGIAGTHFWQTCPLFSYPERTSAHSKKNLIVKKGVDCKEGRDCETYEWSAALEASYE